IQLHYLGLVAAPFAPEHIRGNRFHILVRDLAKAQLGPAEEALNELRQDGVANYFDDQRFGSVGPDRRFVARYLVTGSFEASLRLALTGHYEFDRAKLKRQKDSLRKHWGDWPRCKAIVPTSGPARGPIEHLLANPGDFRGAVARLQPEQRRLHLA